MERIRCDGRGGGKGSNHKEHREHKEGKRRRVLRRWRESAAMGAGAGKGVTTKSTGNRKERIELKNGCCEFSDFKFVGSEVD